MPRTELDSLLTEAVTPLLRAPEWQQRGRRYVRTVPSGDFAQIHFERRDTDAGRLSWTTSLAVGLEPISEFLASFHGVESAPTPVWTKQWFQRLPSGHVEGFWSLARGADRDLTARQVRDDLEHEIRPQLTALLDRRTFIDCLRMPGLRFVRLGGRFHVAESVAEAVLLAEYGPSHRLAELMAAMWDGHPIEAHARQWVARRLAHGPAGAGNLAPNEVEQPNLPRLLAAHVDERLRPLGLERRDHTYRGPLAIGGTLVIDVIASSVGAGERAGFFVLVGRTDIPGSARSPRPTPIGPPNALADSDPSTISVGLPRWLVDPEDRRVADAFLAIAQAPPPQ